MSSLEDVFLRIARDAEAEEARASGACAMVTLHSGEVVGVPLGSEEALTSPNGTGFTVEWGTDDQGQLVPVDTREAGRAAGTAGVAGAAAEALFAGEGATEAAAPAGAAARGARAARLRAPFWAQADALFRKNASYQWRRRCACAPAPPFLPLRLPLTTLERDCMS